MENPQSITEESPATDLANEVIENTTQPPAEPTAAEEPQPAVPETSTGTAVVEEPALTPQADIESLIAQAEQRGYKRGRNERIAELMEQPSDADPELASTRADAPEILILNDMRPSIWG